MKESEIQRAILDYLAAKHILAFRMNTGAVKSEYNGKARFMRFGVPGMADILAFLTVHTGHTGELNYGRPREITYTEALWIEVKAEKGKQSELQKSFQQQVEAKGHKYLLARSVEDVIAAL